MFHLALVFGLGTSGQEIISSSKVESYLPCKNPGKCSVDLDTNFENAKGWFFSLAAQCKSARVQMRKEYGSLPSADVTLHSLTAKSMA